MYDKHQEIEDEAYKLLGELVGRNMDPSLINDIVRIKSDINKRYSGEYFVDITPLSDPIVKFVAEVTVHTVH